MKPTFSLETLIESPLFKELSLTDIQGCLLCAGAREKTFEKGEYVFHAEDTPMYLHVLVSGSVAIGSDTSTGKETIIAVFNDPGTLFGEVFAFLENHTYDHFARATEATTVLTIPKHFLYSTCQYACQHHQLLLRNMLQIITQKAYFLNQRVHILSGTSLRQKIARTLLLNDPTVSRMTRDQLANFVNAARPSVSRELMQMQEEGLITVTKEGIVVAEKETLEELL